MSQTRLNAEQMLDREFLEIRCRLIDIAAAMDRIDSSSEFQRVAGDPRYALIKDALALLAAEEKDRAERVQMIFSDPYDAQWKR